MKLENPIFHEGRVGILQGKEEPTPTGSQVKWEPKIINEFLDASQFKGNDRINHFLLQAIRQLDTDEIKGLIDGLSGYVPKEEPKTGDSQEQLWKEALQKINVKTDFRTSTDGRIRGLGCALLDKYTITRKQTEQ